MDARVGLIFSMAALLAPMEAAAQACCNATSAGEIGVVGRCQQAVLGAQLSYTHGTARYDQRGQAQALGAQDSEDVVWTLAGGAHVASRVQLHAALPLRLHHRALGASHDEVAFGVGDVEAGVGVLVLDDDMVGITGDASSWTPFVELTLTGHAPTGRSAHESERLTQADVTGEGSWGAAVSARVAKSITTEHTLRLRGELRWIGPHHAAAGEFDPGELASLSAGWGYAPSLFWNFGVQAAWSWRDEARLNGERVASSLQRRTSVGVFASHALAFPDWELVGAASMDALWDGAGANVARTGPSVSLGVRRNFMTW